MANHAQAKKRNRQRIKKTIRNRHFRTALRSSMKQVRSLLDGGEPEKAQEALKTAVTNLDKAVTRGLLQRRTASRTISRLTHAVRKVGNSPVTNQPS